MQSVSDHFYQNISPVKLHFSEDDFINNEQGIYLESDLDGTVLKFIDFNHSRLFKRHDKSPLPNKN